MEAKILLPGTGYSEKSSTQLSQKSSSEKKVFFSELDFWESWVLRKWLVAPKVADLQ